MQNILIVGAGGLGREVRGYLQHIEKAGAASWRVKGFLDDNQRALDGLNYSEGVVGTIADYLPSAGDLLVCAIANTAAKARVCTQLKERGARFMTLVHPTAVIGCNVVMGEGVVVAPNVIINSDATVGDFVLLNCFSACGHDAHLGDYCTTSSYCDITGGVQMGKRVFMGSHACIIPKRKIGDDVTIGAGSVVTAHLAAGQKVFGVPAKRFM